MTIRRNKLTSSQVLDIGGEFHIIFKRINLDLPFKFRGSHFAIYEWASEHAINIINISGDGVVVADEISATLLHLSFSSGVEILSSWELSQVDLL